MRLLFSIGAVFVQEGRSLAESARRSHCVTVPVGLLAAGRRGRACFDSESNGGLSDSEPPGPGIARHGPPWDATVAKVRTSLLRVTVL